ncbi:MULTISPECIES: response regulator transcription factor [Staphylococcus]|uniref:Response regulator ArlR n=1 Tax=Staphylococcus chromogenes TaxID=46126 RepID=A0AAJ2K925_STACR|nr:MULTISPECIES: response regulator transcription factor [Staphylococcus]KDP12590.1 two-component response regulator [Staphylococcus chromogenes MU 970]MBP0046287.1 response regulator transcription factor [Staphylococcus chromogenes]MBV5137772.1 response regulator transcription factor [Staphylococcus chromogenes]MBV5191530.1 response regulator transcription factor [Staphylococcus chromogenes]MBW3131878.1 response regulator transcription factor [Staphylococcus chromogenes]
MNHILIVEDDEKIARVLQLELEFAEYEVSIAYTGKEALQQFEDHQFDLILLDVMLPELNGLEVLRRIRKKDTQVKVIMLTARDAVMDKVGGLDSGANDYMTKPFEIEELLARIRVHLKDRAPHMQETKRVFSHRHIQVDTSAREVYREGTLVNLTPKEYELLVYLLENKNQALERDQIIAKVWAYDYQGDTNVVDVYVRHLRKKLDQSKPSLISSVRGYGYMIKD